MSTNLRPLIFGVGLAALAVTYVGVGAYYKTHKHHAPIAKKTEPVKEIAKAPPPAPAPVVKTCRITGDSIAVMLAMAGPLHMCDVVVCGVKTNGPHCTAKGAMNTKWILDHTVPGADVAIISATSNDTKDWHIGKRGPDGRELRQLLANPKAIDALLEAIRAKAKAKVYVWIKPSLIEPGEAVERIAKKYGDLVVPFVPGRDGVHPRNPKGVDLAVLAKVPTLAAMTPAPVVKKAEIAPTPELKKAGGAISEMAMASRIKDDASGKHKLTCEEIKSFVNLPPEVLEKFRASATAEQIERATRCFG